MARSFWLPPESRQSDEVQFPPEERHHLLHVLRKTSGDRVEVLWQQQRLLVELIEEEKILKGRILETWPIPTPPFVLDLAQALPKGRKMEQVVSLAAQIGVRRLIPVHSSRSVVHLNAADGLRKRERWQKQAEEEAKVTGALPLQVSPPVSLANALKMGQDADLRFFFWENADCSLLNVLAQATSPRWGFLVIGPEGGFTPEESDLAKHHDFQTVSLGERVFRTETAGLIASVLLLAHGGAFRLTIR